MAFTPPFVSFIQDLLTAVQAQTTAILAMEATIAAQAADIAQLKSDASIHKNFMHYQLESFYGANSDITDIAAGNPYP